MPREMKLSVAFTLNNIEEIKEFFEVLQLYWIVPDIEEYQTKLENLKKQVDDEEKELERLKERKAKLLSEIRKLEASMTNPKEEDETRKEFLENFTASV
jgi:chromosome segregation ATPase